VSGLHLRTKIVLLSALVMTVVVIILDITLVTLYSANLRSLLDEQLQQDAQQTRRSLSFNGKGELDRYQQPDTSSSSYTQNIRARYLVRAADGRPLRRAFNMIAIELPVDKNWLKNRQNLTQDIHFAGLDYRMLSTYLPADSHPGRNDLVMQVVRPLAPLQQGVEDLVTLLLWLSPLPLILLVTGSVWAVGISLRPMNGLIETVKGINAKELDVRVPVTQRDEVGKLAETFNDLLDRLEKAFQSLRQFSADASHELRTPLTSIRTQAEVALHQSRTENDYRDVIGSLLEDVARMEHLIDSLLQLARGDAGLIQTRFEQVNFSQLVGQWCDHLVALAEEQNISMQLEIEANVMISGDTTLLERMVINLIDNAIQYTPAGGIVRISLLCPSDKIEFSVCDTGPGIPEGDRQRIFNRFTRLQATRHQTTGAGLGLAITSWVVDLHGGIVDVSDGEDGGACFRVIFGKR